MHRILFFFLGLNLVLSSCSNYNEIIKGDDYVKKFELANALFDDEEFLKSIVLYEQIYQHAPKSGEGELAYYRLGRSYYNGEDYYMAGYYFSSYIQRFPYSANNEELMFLAAMCKVQNSPELSLDQTETEDAINAVQIFVDSYPTTVLMDSCNQIIDRLRQKIETKEFNNVMLYAQTERYRAAVASAEIFLEKYPSSIHAEEAFSTMVRNSYYLTVNSIESKKSTRIDETIERMRKFEADFPGSDDIKSLNQLVNKLLN
jgi:outer membrane protein assembly factor BamD